MAEKRNLLDEFEEEMMYDSKDPLNNWLHPVEYAAPLANIGTKIGKNIIYGSVAHGAKKGKSARDIIRDEKSHIGRTVHPVDVLYDIDAKKNDLEDFVNAYDKIERQRAFRTTPGQGTNRDYLEIRDADERISKMQRYNESKSRGLLDNQAQMTYGVPSWQEWLDAKKSAKEQGRKLGKMFAKYNQREKDTYGNISAGLGPKSDPVPKGAKIKYALGNQNHRYARNPAKIDEAMTLSQLNDAGYRIRYLNDGTPVIDSYTWTQIPNIEKIKKTGYLAIEGDDTAVWHQGTKGHWTSNRDDAPMDSNYVNGAKIFGRGMNGETFNEELLHTRVPLKWYQKAPIIHQGDPGWGVKIDVIQAKPGSPEVMVGEGVNRKSAKVATPAQFIEHITEKQMRPNWAYIFKKDMLPGSHPNKQELDYNTTDALKMIDEEIDESELDYMPSVERRKYLLDLLKDDENKRKLLKKVVRNENQYNRVKDESKRKALKDYYVNLDLSGMTAYDIVNEGVNPPIK